MSNIKYYNILKKYGSKLGREKLSIKIIEICKQVAEEEHYKNAIIACGKLHALSIACSQDSYWGEKASMGFSDIVEKAELNINDNEKK
jgi:hypothetical protein